MITPFAFLFIDEAQTQVQQAQELECEVNYIARKAEKDRRWFGTVKEARIKSGMEEGKGKNKSECRDNALFKLTSNGWQITSEKVRVK